MTEHNPMASAVVFPRRPCPCTFVAHIPEQPRLLDCMHLIILRMKSGARRSYLR
jgi:hypothetical protein